ncbi:hypothetical protein ACE6H2_022092 [Prunus campanulata]
MERQKRKFVAAASCEVEGGRRGRMTDRFSNLPDQIAHVILSFLTMADLARLSYVSKCWRELCLSSPVLNFNEYNCIAAADMCDSKQRLLNILERFLLLRADHKIQRFRFDWHFPPPKKNQSSSSSCSCRDVYYRVMSCVQKATRVDEFEPLSEVFHGLRINEVLILNEAAIKVMFKLEGSMPVSFNNVRSLRMNIGCVIDEIVPSMVSVLRGMPYLRTLYIKRCPPFHELESNKCGFDIEYWKLQNLGFINRLEFFTIEILDWYNVVELASYVLECAQKLKKCVIICSAQNLEEVKLKLEKCKMISKSAIVMFKLEGSIPVSFENVRRLRIDIGSISDDVDPPLVSLFRRMPNLYDLGVANVFMTLHHMQVESLTTEPLDEFNEVVYPGILLECAQKLTKFVIICSPQNLEKSKMISKAAIVFKEDRKKNLVKLAKYIVGCAQKLEKVDIICSPQNLEEFKRKLEKAKSSTAQRSAAQHSTAQQWGSFSLAIKEPRAASII